MGMIMTARYKRGNVSVSEISVDNYTEKTLKGMETVISEWNKMHPSGNNIRIKEEMTIATLSIEFDKDDDFHIRLFPIFATNVLENENPASPNISYDDDDAYAY